MKKLFVAAMAVLMLVSAALAEGADFSGMSQDEILDVINAWRNALVLEEAEDCLLKYDTGHGITIIFRAFCTRPYSDDDYISVTIVNDSDTDYKIYCDSLYINGWSVYTVQASHVKAHRRMNDEWGFRLSDAGLRSTREITEMEYDLRITPEQGRASDKLDIPTAVIIIK